VLKVLKVIQEMRVLKEHKVLIQVLRVLRVP
jgi:hypothetical protein